MSLDPNTEELVRQAARTGASQAIQDNRLRLRLYSGLFGFLAACAVCIPVTVVLSNNARAQARQEVAAVEKTTAAHDRTLCVYQRDGRQSGNRLRFALRELLAFDTDILQAAEHPSHSQTAQRRADTARFLAREQARLDRDLRVERKVIPDLPRKLTYTGLFIFFRDQPLISCPKLGVGGR